MAMPGKESKNGVYEFPYMKPPQRSGWESFKLGLYDSSSGAILGRTGKSWAQILFFYTIFYIILGAMFAICMQGMLSTIDENMPKWQQEESLIGNNPGLGFRPISNRTEEGSLIWFNSKNETSVQKWIDLTEDFLRPYLKSSVGTNQVPCEFGKTAPAGHVCTVNLTNFGPCGPDSHYGYKSTSPCVFLKLNRIYGWQPEYFSDINNLPDNMPAELVQHINGLKEIERTQIWVTCEGEHPADKEHVSLFSFFPNRGFQSYYYPYTNVNGYLSPLIAVQIQQPRPNVVINIECRAWAKNIRYRGGNRARAGSIHFELMRDV